MIWHNLAEIGHALPPLFNWRGAGESRNLFNLLKIYFLDLCEPTLVLIAKLIPFCKKKVFRGVDDTALPLIVLSVLPKLILSYDSLVLSFDWRC